ncbi:endo-1,3(4)-beta-glucanase 1, partial [Plakobranchus ocellatus]
MNFAVNYIGHYLLPWDWSNKPEEATCTSKRGIFDLHMSATCQSSRQFTISVDLGSEAFPGLNKDILAAIERDAQNENLDAVCSHTDSYNGGKAIGMVSRLASLSRAFGTNHYVKLEESIKKCLEKWLRVQ